MHLFNQNLPSMYEHPDMEEKSMELEVGEGHCLCRGVAHLHPDQMRELELCLWLFWKIERLILQFNKASKASLPAGKVTYGAART